MSGCSRGKCPRNGAQNTEVRGDKGAEHLKLTTPLRAQSGPGANFGCLRQWFRPRAYKVGLHVMVCNVFFCLVRKGVGDLGRKWLDAGDERIEKNIVQVCFYEGLMLSTACDEGSENRFESRRGKRVIKLLTRTRNTLVTAKDGI